MKRAPWALEWSRLAELDVKRIHWREAERACRAMLSYATGGTGDIERGAGGAGRLRVSRSVVLFMADPATRTLHVWRILSAPKR